MEPVTSVYHSLKMVFSGYAILRPCVRLVSLVPVGFPAVDHNGSLRWSVGIFHKPLDSGEADCRGAFFFASPDLTTYSIFQQSGNQKSADQGMSSTDSQ